MSKNLWLPCLLMVTASSPLLMAKEELPDPEKPSFVTGCSTSLIKDERTIAKKMPQILFCIQKNMDAFADGKKLPDPNFVETLRKGDVSRVLREDYKGGEVLANYLTGIDQLTGKSGGSDVRNAIRSKAKAKAAIENAKMSLDKAKSFALKDLIGAWADDEDGSLFVKQFTTNYSVKLLPAKRARYGSRDVTKQAKAPLGPIFFRESNAQDRRIENLGYMLAAVNKLVKNPQDIPSHPKFIKAAAASVRGYWSTLAAYNTLDEAGFAKVRELVMNTARVAGALDFYEAAVNKRTTSAQDKLQDNMRLRNDSRQVIKGTYQSYDAGSDEEEMQPMNAGGTEESFPPVGQEEATVDDTSDGGKPLSPIVAEDDNEGGVAVNRPAADEPKIKANTAIITSTGENADEFLDRIEGEPLLTPTKKASGSKWDAVRQGIQQRQTVSN